MNTDFKRRVIVSVLWMANTVIDLVQIALGSMHAQWIADIQKGQIAGFPVDDTTIGIFAFSMVVPALMAYAVLAIPSAKLNRWLNFVLVVVIGLMSWADFLQRSVGEIGLSNWVVALATNIPLTIAAFYAWRLGREEVTSNR